MSEKDCQPVACIAVIQPRDDRVSTPIVLQSDSTGIVFLASHPSYVGMQMWAATCAAVSVGRWWNEAAQESEYPEVYTYYPPGGRDDDPQMVCGYPVAGSEAKGEDQLL